MSPPDSKPIHIHQIYYIQRQVPGLDPAFLPYDNSLCPTPDEREFYVFKKEYLEGRIPNESYSGYVSWKFGAKTGISGREFVQFCQSHPGADVYYINPFPREICKGNVWEHGEKIHPGLKDLARLLFERAGYAIDLDHIPQSILGTVYCNFWVGNKEFWDGYMRFCLPIYEAFHTGLSVQERQQILAKADRIVSASYFSYIFERLFSTYILLNPQIRRQPYLYTQEQLTLKYSAPTAALLTEIQQLELKGSLEPARTDPRLKAAAESLAQRVEDSKFLDTIYTGYLRLAYKVPLLNASWLKRGLKRVRNLIFGLAQN